MSSPVWTFSNILSLSRVLLVAPMGYCIATDFPDHRLWAGGLMVLAITTDFLDGYIARRLHEVSELGKIVDPIADKIGVGVVGILLLWSGDLPWWFIGSVLLRDVLILAGGVYIKKRKNIIAQSNWPGKITVSVIALYFFLSTLRIDPLESFRELTLWASVVLMIFSLGSYTRRLFIGPKTAKIHSLSEV